MEFKTGMKLETVIGHMCWSVGAEIKEIEVVMQNGQMALVPWAAVKDINGKVVCLINLALAESVVPAEVVK